jgi:hypothetical protein
MSHSHPTNLPTGGRDDEAFGEIVRLIEASREKALQAVAGLGFKRRALHVHLQTPQLVQGLEHIPMPQIPLEGLRSLSTRGRSWYLSFPSRPFPAALWRSALAPSIASPHETNLKGVRPPGPLQRITAH